MLSTYEKIRSIREKKELKINALSAKAKASAIGRAKQLSGDVLSMQRQDILREIKEQGSLYNPQGSIRSVFNQMCKALEFAGVITMKHDSKGRVSIGNINKERLEKCIEQRRILFPE